MNFLIRYGNLHRERATKSELRRQGLVVLVYFVKSCEDLKSDSSYKAFEVRELYSECINNSIGKHYK